MSKPYGWAKADGSFRREAPDNPEGWTPLFTQPAPDLLAALESIALAPCACIPPDFDGEDTIVCNGCIARAAIDKAKGEA